MINLGHRVCVPLVNGSRNAGADALPCLTKTLFSTPDGKLMGRVG